MDKLRLLRLRASYWGRRSTARGRLVETSRSQALPRSKSLSRPSLGRNSSTRDLFSFSKRHLTTETKETTTEMSKEFACFGLGLGSSLAYKTHVRALGYKKKKSAAVLSPPPSPPLSPPPSPPRSPRPSPTRSPTPCRRRDPKFYKLALQPSEIDPRWLLIHGLWMQTGDDRTYYSDTKSNELYKEEVFSDLELEILNLIWVEGPEGHLEFRQRQWKGHGKFFGMTVYKYFSQSAKYYMELTEALNLESYEGESITAKQLSEKLEKALEKIYGVSGVYPEIVCRDPDFEGKVRLRELYICYYEADGKPRCCRCLYRNCVADTLIHLG